MAGVRPRMPDKSVATSRFRLATNTAREDDCCAQTIAHHPIHRALRGAAASVLLTGVGEIYLQEHYKKGGEQRVSNDIEVAAIERKTHPTQGFGWGTKLGRGVNDARARSKVPLRKTHPALGKPVLDFRSQYRVRQKHGDSHRADSTGYGCDFGSLGGTGLEMAVADNAISLLC
jgi:hypothetical protein